MKDFIQDIYDSRTVVGKSGKLHKLHAEIDTKEGEFLFEIIHKDPEIIKTLEVGCAYGLSSLHICSALEKREGTSHTILDPFIS